MQCDANSPPPFNTTEKRAELNSFSYKKACLPYLSGRKDRLSYMESGIKLTCEVADEGLIRRLAEHLFDAVVFYEVCKEL